MTATFIAGITTGQLELRPCARCRVQVEHSELLYRVGDDKQASLWLPEKHIAQCGLPCRIRVPGMDVPKRIHPGPDCPHCARLSVRPEGGR